MIDTHTHVYMDDFDADRAEVIARARQAGIELMIMPCVNIDSLPRMEAVEAQWPDMVRQAIGLHPSDVAVDTWQAQVDAMEAALKANPGKYVAVGEIGLDLHWDDAAPLDIQRQAFRRQALMALEAGLPLIVHTRDAWPETAEALASLPQMPGLVVHCFGGSATEVEMIRRVAPEAMFGLNGIATFKNCKVCDAIDAIGLDKLIVETDSPWLAPTPHRGKRCEPAMTALTLAHIAARVGMEPEKLDAITTANARRLFAL